MGFFDTFLDWLFHPYEELFGRSEDCTRDNICAGLRSLGIDAQMEERGQPEEEIRPYGHSRFGVSLGLIDIPEGPIHWVNVRKMVIFWGRMGGEPLGGPSSAGMGFDRYADYAVPDPRLSPSFHTIRMTSVLARTSPSVDEVVDLHWEGNDLGLGIIDRLNSDEFIKGEIMRSGDNVEIDAHPDDGCWIISTEAKVPSQSLWRCYEAIAQHLLAE